MLSLKSFVKIISPVYTNVECQHAALSRIHTLLYHRNNPLVVSSKFIHVESTKLPSTIQQEELDKLYRLIEVEVRGNDPAVLKSYSRFATTAADHLGIDKGKCWTPKKAHHERFTVLRSVHVQKRCRVQYEFRTYFHFMQFHRLTGSTADTFLEYIQRNLPEGVAMKVTKVGIEKLPEHVKPPAKVGIEKLPEHVKPPAKTSDTEIAVE